MHVVPAPLDQLPADPAAAQQPAHGSLLLACAHRIEDLARQVAQAGRKHATLQLEEAEDDLGVAVSVGHVLEQGQIGLMA